MTIETPAAAAPVEAHPAEVAWLLQVQDPQTGVWRTVARPYTVTGPLGPVESVEALGRLAERQAAFADLEHRLVERTTTYRVVSGGAS